MIDMLAMNALLRRAGGVVKKRRRGRCDLAGCGATTAVWRSVASTHPKAHAGAEIFPQVAAMRVSARPLDLRVEQIDDVAEHAEVPVEFIVQIQVDQRDVFPVHALR